jgi:predicted dinucleotide-utilizing enzyme
VDAEQTSALKTSAVWEAIRSTEWPGSAFSAPDSHLILAIVGEGELGTRLTRTAAEQRVRGRSVEVRLLKYPDQSAAPTPAYETELREFFEKTRAAHALFVCDSERDHVETIANGLGNANVLTLSDIDAFTGRGGMLGPTLSRGRVVFKTNLARIHGTQLKVGLPLPDAAENDRASTIKAAMVLNFIRYTDWPANAFAAAENPIILTIVGNGEMGDQLMRAIKDQSVHGRAVEVRQLAWPLPREGRDPNSDGDAQEFRRNVRASHVLFICDSERTRVESLFKILEGANVLTVSDTDGFVVRGGMLGLTLRRERVAFDANPDEIQKTQLKVSSQLLRLARTSKTGGS